MVGRFATHTFSDDFSCFYALQELDNWEVTEMEVGNSVVHGRDYGKAAIIYRRQVTMMILSVLLPHGGCDEDKLLRHCARGYQGHHGGGQGVGCQGLPHRPGH